MGNPTRRQWTKTNPMGMLHRSPAHRRTRTILTISPIMDLLLVNNNGHNHNPTHSKVNPGSINNPGTVSSPAMAIIPEDSTGLACDVIFISVLWYDSNTL
ncbi:unnamed protein product [Rhizoctonia solani]|uniref:Uncharacterized protein n=1 Tax=Rhizoctonia solani TaxID=456999 RepID=A0A8H2Y0X4_9AGAM|nr:unnamed protein product [Rhizoctonia solani]